MLLQLHWTKKHETMTYSQAQVNILSTVRAVVEFVPDKKGNGIEFSCPSDFSDPAYDLHE